MEGGGEAGAECTAGDYYYDNNNKNGNRDYTIECTDDKLSKRITYYADGVTKAIETTYYESTSLKKIEIYYGLDGATKTSERTYYEGKEEYRKTWIDYRTDGTKITERTYNENGRQKTQIGYYTDGVTKRNETNHYANGVTRKTQIEYRTDGTKSNERTYYENTGNHKTRIDYQTDGTKESGFPKCFEDVGSFTTETCTDAKHGCTSASDTCIN